LKCASPVKILDLSFLAELKEEIDKLKPALEKMSIEDTVKSIREDRDSR
jgi:hypothetical protein